MKYLFALSSVLLVSCANHTDDGVYVGSAGLTAVAWVINGNDVTIYTTGQVHTEPIEHGDGYVRLVSNGALLVIRYDSVGYKSLVMQSIIPIKLKRVSERTNIPATEIMAALNEGFSKINF